MDFITSYFRKTGRTRVVMMLVGSVLLSLGISVFRLAGLGNDPYNGMLLGLSAHLPIDYGTFGLLLAAATFVVQLFFERRTIGVGTFFNLLFQAYIAAFFFFIWTGVMKLDPQAFAVRLIVVCIGVGFTSLGLALYQSANCGIAPYDSLSLILAKRFPKVGYFWFRILTDGICALICFVSGGIVGIGMVIAAFGQGPIIAFFNRTIAEPILARERK